MGNIYRITSRTSGKSYIGQTTKSIEHRWSKHQLSVKTGMQTVFAKAIRLYGTEDFIVELLEIVDDDQLSIREQWWITNCNTKIPSGYNMTDGGESTLGYKHTVEDRIKMSNSHIGKSRPPMTDECKAKISAAHKGKSMSIEARQNLSIKHTGKTLSAEHKTAISTSLRNRKSNQEQE